MRFSIRRRATGTFAALLGTAAAMACAPAAHAGDYTVPVCVRPDGTTVGQLLDATLDGTQRPNTFYIYECDKTEGGINLTFQGDQAEGGHSAGEFARLSVSASGAGMSIVGASGQGRSIPGMYDISFGPIAPARGPCGGPEKPGCFIPRDWSGQWAAPTAQAALERLNLAITCNQPTCGSGQLYITRMAVTYRDVGAPAAGTTSGNLLASTPGSPISGKAAVRFTATDTGSGMQYGNVLVDGRIVGSTGVQCSAPYERQHPCPTRLEKEVEVDTTQISNGTHELEVTATDAAGNATSVHRSTVIVDNGGPRGPGTDPNLRGAPIGSYGSDDARLDAWWPATARKPSSSRRVQKNCKRKAYRRKHALACEGRPASRRLRADFSAKKANLVRGRLVTPAGEPVAGGRIDVVATPTAEGAAPRAVGTIQTDATGRFATTVPVSTGSTTYTLNWIARTRDTLPVTATTVARTVRAATTFRVRPGRTVKRGQPLVFTGSLRGTEGARAGNAVTIQANPGKTWRVVKTVRTQADGSWRVRYVVPRQLRGRYRFRAVVAPSASYPYSVGATASRSIRVR